MFSFLFKDVQGRLLQTLPFLRGVLNARDLKSCFYSSSQLLNSVSPAKTYLYKKGSGGLEKIDSYPAEENLLISVLNLSKNEAIYIENNRRLYVTFGEEERDYLLIADFHQALSEEDKNFLQHYALLIKDSFERLEEIKTLYLKAEKMRQLSELTLTIVRSDQPYAMSEILVEGAAAITGCSRVLYLQYHAGQDILSIESFIGVDGEFLNHLRPALKKPVATSSNLFSTVFVSGEPMMAQDLINDYRWLLPDPAVNHAYLVPVISENYRHGLLVLLGTSQEKITIAEQSMALVLANQVAAAMETAVQRMDLLQKAHTDKLTGLANRAVLQKYFTREANRADHNFYEMALLLMDMDNFKRYNDTFGHLAGDGLLRKVGEVIRSCIRPYDLAVRYGGDEFLILLPKANAEVGRLVARRITSGMNSINDPLLVDKDWTVTMSIGIAVRKPFGDDLNSLIEKADRAMYQAKESRDGAVVLSSEE
ncbi:sensor domain-containing diguanylate cyclase [Carboxydothermus pertinax]|uniref:Sensor domain-containing diguanylate cyclase n=1 Tax=Carboxydothermus pertinax TaxID=870242 RepID=A0A1L8CTL9_9THEO|nr:sensor domain-containing diguanylate cyclase [Carboxydothermus pertinax]GAV22247.1 sensor domain-containing diguanylate cyclase [Carboxydothermus pertinax]